MKYKGLFILDTDVNVLGANGALFDDFGTMRKNKGTNSLFTVPYQTEPGSTTDLKPLKKTIRFSKILPIKGTMLNWGGTIQVADVLDLEGGTLSGVGASTIQGDVLNNGTVNGILPGIPNSFANITITGNYSQPTGVLNLGIGGTTGGTNFDQLTITGAAVLAGTLNVSLINGFTPSLGQTFQILTFGSYTGNFQTVTGLQLGSNQFDIQYNSTNVTLVVVAASSPSAPTVTALSANTGTTAGGTSVTITGTNFYHVTGVSFGTITANSFTVNSTTSITASAPPHATGTVDITVTTATGTSSTSSSDQFSYTAGTGPTVTGVSPSIGDSGGDTTVVTVTGTNFLGTTAVYFGTTPADYFIVNSATKITALAPAHAAGTVDITLSTGSGTSSTSSADHFAYAGVPSVSGISPILGSCPIRIAKHSSVHYPSLKRFTDG